jgi:hypothetical protein
MKILTEALDDIRLSTKLTVILAILCIILGLLIGKLVFKDNSLPYKVALWEQYEIFYEGNDVQGMDYMMDWVTHLSEEEVAALRKYGKNRYSQGVLKGYHRATNTKGSLLAQK